MKTGPHGQGAQASFSTTNLRSENIPGRLPLMLFELAALDHLLVDSHVLCYRLWLLVATHISTLSPQPYSAELIDQLPNYGRV